MTNKEKAIGYMKDLGIFDDAIKAFETDDIVFFSIKGGVGRSTALAATAWSLAQEGKRVLVLDLDLESPGLSSALLPSERQPMYGIIDWLIEDLVDNGDVVFESMVATSNHNLFVIQWQQRISPLAILSIHHPVFAPANRHAL